jgi:TonB family protein
VRLPSLDTTSLILALTLFASVVAHAGVHYSLGVLAKAQALEALLREREAASRRGDGRAVLEFELSDDQRPAPEVRPSTSVDPSAQPPSDAEAPDVEQAETEEARRARLRAERLARARQQREQASAEAVATAQPEERQPEPEPEPELQLTPPAPTPPTPPPPPPQQEEERIAVRQHSENPDDPPPDTVYIADENNTVEEETVAEITNLDRDDVETSVGAELEQPTDPLEEEGNADDETLAESEDVDGSEERRPTPEEVTRRPRERPNTETRAEGRTTADAPADSRAERTPGGDGATGAAAQRQAGVRGRAGGGDPNAGGAAALLAAAQGDWTLRTPGSLGAGGGDGAGGVPIPQREAREGVPRGSTRGQADRGRRPGERTGRPGPDLTLRYSQLVDIVGEERLAEEREAHFAEQRSRIRGSSSGANWQQFRAALENYMPSVRPGAQTALNAARSPFATYVARIHDRLHQTYHDFVQNLPLEASGPFSDPNLRTLLEIVLNRDGSVHRVGVVRSSGLSMFDYGAYNAVMRGQPYPVAPDEILSGDGRIYMHWDFHRQQPYCHQSHARPYILPNIGGAREDELPVQQLQDSTLVPSDARVNYGVGGQSADDEALDDEELDDEELEEDEEGHDHEAEADPEPPAPRSRGPRL